MTDYIDWLPISHPDRPLRNSLIAFYIPGGGYVWASGSDFEKVLFELEQSKAPLPSHWRTMFEAPEGADGPTQSSDPASSPTSEAS